MGVGVGKGETFDIAACLPPDFEKGQSIKELLKDPVFVRNIQRHLLNLVSSDEELRSQLTDQQKEQLGGKKAPEKSQKRGKIDKKTQSFLLNALLPRLTENLIHFINSHLEFFGSYGVYIQLRAHFHDLYFIIQDDLKPFKKKHKQEVKFLKHLAVSSDEDIASYALKHFSKSRDADRGDEQAIAIDRGVRKVVKFLEKNGLGSNKLFFINGLLNSVDWN